MNVAVTFKFLDAEETNKHICSRDIVCKDVNIDLIIGLPYILYYIILYYIITYSLSSKHIQVHGHVVKFAKKIIMLA